MNRVDTRALCWRLERRDGAGLALTSHDAAVTVEGVRYEPAPGLLPAAIHRRGGLEPGSAEIDGSIDTAALSEADLEIGRWNGAAFRLDMVDWEQPDVPPAFLLAGALGEVAMRGGGFTADLVGPASALDAPVCPSTSSECRAAFGGPQCRVDLSARRTIGRVVTVDGNRIATDPAAVEVHVGGRLIIMSGAATGWQSPIVGVENGMAVVRDAPWQAPEEGTRVWIVEGCDKRFETCRDRFANAANFRGEPYLPGNDLLTRYPGG